MKKVAAKYFQYSIFLLVVISDANAANYEYGLYANFERTDNVQQDVDQEAGNTMGYGGDFLIESTGNQSVIYSAFGDVGRREFDEESGLEAEETRELNASIIFRPLQSNFGLILLDTYTQIARDRTATQQTGNLRDINVFSITPTYEFTITRSDRVELEYSYNITTDFDALSDQDDSSRTTTRAVISYERDVSSTVTSGLQYRHGTVDYEVDREGYEVDDVVISFSVDYALSRFLLSVGQSRVITEFGFEEESELVELDAYRTVNRRNSIGLHYRYGIGQELNEVLDDTSFEREINEQAAFINDLLQESQIELRHGYDGYSWDWETELFHNELKSLDGFGMRDEVVQGGTSAVSIAVGNYFSGRFDTDLSFEYEYAKNEFLDQDITYTSSTIAIGLTTQFRENWEVFGEMYRRKTEGNLAINNTRENAVLVGIRYSPHGQL